MISIMSLILVLILIPGFSACMGNTTSATETDKDPETQTVKVTNKQTSGISNLFDARDIKSGDTIAGMKIEFVDMEPGPDPNNEDNYFAIVKFSGNLELSGKYISYSDQPLLGRSIIFYPDKESANLIPRLTQDMSEGIWFVFENYNEAIGLLSQPDSGGTATIIIDNYTINYALEVVHTAYIVEVLEKEITTLNR
jgi:hypothetical protein